MEWTQILEKFGVTTAAAFASILLGAKLVSMVLSHYFTREEIHDQNVKRFTEVIFEISSAMRELRKATEDQTKILEKRLDEQTQAIEENSKDAKDNRLEMIHYLKKRTTS
jgi:hypothetical protein